MADFLLVHGSWYGAWCWREVQPRLEDRGHRATALDLPGHGDDPTPAGRVRLQHYVDAIVGAVERQDEPPILVGHCMGGVITQVAEAMPEAIRALIYVAAVVPANGASMMQAVEAADPAYLAQLEWAPDRRSAKLRPEGVRKFLCPLCPVTLVDEALPRISAEPAEPFETPMWTTAGNFGRVPGYYVECLRDRVLPLELQRRMHEAVPCRRVYSLDCDHSPFFSAPGDLAAVLHAVAEET